MRRGIIKLVVVVPGICTIVGWCFVNFAFIVATCRGLSLSTTWGTFIDKIPYIPSFLLSLSNLRHIQNRGEANCTIPTGLERRILRLYVGEFIYESTSCGTQREVTTCIDKQGKIEQKQPDHGANPPPHYGQHNSLPMIPKGLIHLEYGIEH